MLTLNLIREKPDEVVQRLMIKNFDASKIISEVVDLDKNRRSLKNLLDNKQAEVNLISKKIGELMRINRKEDADSNRQRTADLKSEIKNISDQLAEAEQKLEKILVQIPNLPSTLVPEGKIPGENVEVRSGGIMPALSETAVPHWDLARTCNIIDFDLGSKLTGAGFPVYQGMGSKLQRSLINFFLDENIIAGYQEIMPPLMVNEKIRFWNRSAP